MVEVIWHAQELERGYYNCTHMLNEMFDFHDCRHFGFVQQPRAPYIDGAVFVIHGGRELGGLDRLNYDIETLKWVLLIFLGDEEGAFPIENVEHPNKIVWIQEPRFRHRHGNADRYLIDGYPAPCSRRNHFTGTKDLDWSFAGQITHRRRHACAEVLRNQFDWGGVVVESKGYCQGVSPEEYYRLLARSHVVPCPSGPFSPDAARPWEALECNAVPILDELSPVRHEPGFWAQVLGPDHPFPTVDDWTGQGKATIQAVKADWNDWNAATQKWWKQYKHDFFMWLPTDVRTLRERV